MKNAIVAALVAAIVAGPAGAVAATKFSGQLVKPHSMPANRLTPQAVKQFSTSTTQTPRALAAAVASTIDYQQTTYLLPLDTYPVTVTASCQSGETAIGGGYLLASGIGDGTALIFENSITADHTGWEVSAGAAQTNSGTSVPLTVYVSCEPSS